MIYDFTDISILGLRNVLINNGLVTTNEPVILTKQTMISIANTALESGELDELDLILEESGE